MTQWMNARARMAVRTTLARLGLLLCIASCATSAAREGRSPETDAASAGAPANPPGVIHPPERLEDSRPTLHSVKRPADPREDILDLISIAVMIDVDGRPDLTTLAVTGAGAIENRGEIVRWLSSITLRPARNENGVPLRALYRTQFRLPARG